MLQLYTPKEFKMSDRNEIVQFVNANSFGIMVTTVDGVPQATHLPFFYDEEQNLLLAHMARANPQWKTMDGQSALVVFSGPHAYISPSWYGDTTSVPTWNYLAVHIVGRCTVLDNHDELGSILEKTVQFYEPTSDLPSRSDQSFYQNMMRAIVGFRIDITSVEAKAKLSQNKSPIVQQRVIDHLSRSTDPDSLAVAQRMQERLQNE
ncbi:MAG: FMN-binding negative transcriptional regulator [Acidibacillus sp.]|nr:FMN-binding negative transcriptional regulator [Acidibacillus sp.]